MFNLLLNSRQQSQATLQEFLVILGGRVMNENEEDMYYPLGSCSISPIPDLGFIPLASGIRILDASNRSMLQLPYVYFLIHVIPTRYIIII